MRGRTLSFDAGGARAFAAGPLQDVHGPEALKRDLAARFGERVRLEEGLGTVTAVDAGINGDWALARRALAVAEAASAKVHGLSVSALQLTLLVGREHLKPLTARLHREFLGG